MENSLLKRMREHIKAEAEHVGLLLLDIAIVIMCIVTIGLAWGAGAEFFADSDMGYSEDFLYYITRDGNYTSLAYMTWTNRMNGKGERVDSQEYYAVADYYDAAIQYYICEKAGDAVGAERWLEKMKDAENRMGSFSVEKEKIDRMLRTE